MFLCAFSSARIIWLGFFPFSHRKTNNTRAHTIHREREREKTSWMKKTFFCQQGLWTLSAPSRTAVGPFISAGWNANNEMIIIIIVVIIKKKSQGFQPNVSTIPIESQTFLGTFFTIFPGAIQLFSFFSPIGLRRRSSRVFPGTRANHSFNTRHKSVNICAEMIAVLPVEEEFNRRIRSPVVYLSSAPLRNLPFRFQFFQFLLAPLFRIGLVKRFPPKTQKRDGFELVGWELGKQFIIDDMILCALLSFPSCWPGDHEWLCQRVEWREIDEK